MEASLLGRAWQMAASTEFQAVAASKETGSCCHGQPQQPGTELYIFSKWVFTVAHSLDGLYGSDESCRCCFVRGKEEASARFPPNTNAIW